MTSRRGVARSLLLALVTACGGGSGSGPALGPGDGGSPPTTTTGGGAGSAPNALAVTVDGSSCSAGSYVNKPCVSVTVCAPGTSTCQTIDDVLLDTGSTGLRIFRQALTVPLQQVTVGSAALAECAQWGDGSSDWGPVQMASVVLGKEPTIKIPIHVMDSTYATVPSSCGTPESGPSQAGYNGVLGVGLFLQDCGAGCSADAANGIYYTCTGTTCAGAVVDLSTQVQNPVGVLPQDSNGVVLQLPSVPSGGATSVAGQLLFGIGTRSNNVPANVSMLAADANGYFSTSFDGATYPGYIDTGSNGLFFPPPATGLPDCASPDTTWFCPQSPVSLSATNTGRPGSTNSTVAFRIVNFDTFAASSDNVSDAIGGSATPQAGFDWGLPFHLGRTVYVGLEARTSPLGTGPYFAY